MTIWNGAFASPLRKHRDYCGDIRNHIMAREEPLMLDDAEASRLASSGEEEDDESIDVEELGEGDIPWLCTISFTKDEDSEYEFIIWSDEEPSPEEIVELVGTWVQENINSH